MKATLFVKTIFVLAIIGAANCSKPENLSLDFIYKKRFDSTILEKISEFENLDSIAKREISGHLSISRLFPSNLPFSSASSIWIIVTINGACTPYRSSVFNDLCGGTEHKDTEEPGDYGWHLQQTVFSSKHPSQVMGIDSIHEISKYLEMTPDCFQRSTGRLGFCNQVSLDWNRSQFFHAFHIQINSETPDPASWKIDRISCPISDWLIESDSVDYSAGALAMIKAVSEKREPSLLEKEQIREYYLNEAINYQKTNFKHLLPGQRDLINWLIIE